MKALLLLLGLSLAISTSYADVGENEGCGGSEDANNCTCINTGQEKGTVDPPIEDTNSGPGTRDVNK